MSPVPPAYSKLLASLEAKTLDAIERATFASPDALRIVIDVLPVKDTAGDVIAAGVNVRTESFTPGEVPEAVGAVWVGLCNAINTHMRERGAHDFDCLKRYEVFGK